MSLALHHRQNFAPHPHVAEELEVPVLEPFGVGELLEIARPRAARIVHQDVDFAERLDASRHDPLNVFGLVQVGLYRLDPRAVTPAGERHRFIERLATARAYEHRRALRREPDRSRAPDSLA